MLHVSAQLRQRLPALLLRLGLAIVFVYAAISSLRSPQLWLGYVPEFTTRFLAADTTLRVVSVAQLGLVLWLLVGKYVRYAALISALYLAAIVILDPGAFIITFRDIGLALAAAALYLLDEPSSPKH
jgi:uncharacterized membrane protein YphA (DoxX/SURF4 family)